jgi:DNA-binding XRE family transcriptional regulator
MDSQGLIMSNGSLTAASARKRRAMTRVNADIRDRIHAERVRLGISRTEAAARMGVSRQCYSQLEQRTKDPRVSRLIELVQRVGMRAEALLPELQDQC